MPALRDLVRRGAQGDIVFLTGAGVSAESNIPTFRGKEGYWTVGSTEYHPQELATNRAFAQLPDEVWSWYLYRRTVCRAAAPNPAHLALVELEKALGPRFLLVTQNVDGLHLRAGNSLERTYQVHGNIDYMRCSEFCCNELWEIGELAGEKARGQGLSETESANLKCPRCGARSRPHVLWFDECYDEELFKFHSSLLAAQNASMLVTAGSSGSTNLPTQMVAQAAARGAVLIDINPETNPYGRMAQGSGGAWLKTTASEGMRQLAELLL